MMSTTGNRRRTRWDTNTNRNERRSVC